MVKNVKVEEWNWSLNAAGVKTTTVFKNRRNFVCWCCVFANFVNTYTTLQSVQTLRSLSTNGETNNLVKIIQEALDFHDDFQIPDLPLPPPFLPPKLTETKSSTIPSMPTDQSPSTSLSAIISTGPSSKSKTTTDLGTEVQSADVSHSSTDDESDVVVDVGHDEPPELSPLSSDEIIDVCKTPSPIEKDKHHKKKKISLIYIIWQSKGCFIPSAKSISV